MGGGKKSTKTVQKIQYPAGFERFFKKAGDILLKHAQIPRGDIFQMRLSPFERDIYGRVSSLLSAGTTPIDTFVQNYFLNRMGIPSPLLQLITSEPVLRVLPPLESEELPEYSEPIPPALSLPKREEEEKKEWSLPATWQQLFSVAPLPKSPEDVLRSLPIGAATLQLAREFPETKVEEAQGIISSILSRPDQSWRFVKPFSLEQIPEFTAYNLLQSANLLSTGRKLPYYHPETGGYY